MAVAPADGLAGASGVDAAGDVARGGADNRLPAAGYLGRQWRFLWHQDIVKAMWS